MSLTKIKETNSPLLHRKAYVFSLDSEGPTPKKQDAVKFISANLKVKSELIFIKKIDQAFGENKSKVIANVYDSVENLRKIEKVKEEKKEPSQEEPKKVEEKKQENDQEGKTKE